MDDPDIETDEFVKYMKDSKPNVNGEDIDNWEFDELIEKVQEFKTLKKQVESKGFCL